MQLCIDACHETCEQNTTYYYSSGTPANSQSLKPKIESVKAVLGLLEEEGIMDPVTKARSCYDAFQLNLLLGQLDEAKMLDVGQTGL